MAASMAASTEPSSSDQQESNSNGKKVRKTSSPDYTLKSACMEESKMSLDCIRRHNFQDNSQCVREFENYRNCKKFWTKVQWRRFWKGERPTLPLPEDREQAKKDYAYILEKIVAESEKN